MYKRPKGGAEICGQEHVPQVERYKGSDVIGMEYTTARPLSYISGVDFRIQMPGKAWPNSMDHPAQVRAKKVATFDCCYEDSHFGCVEHPQKNKE